MGADVLIEDPRWNAAGLEPLALRAIAAALKHLSLDPETWEVSVLGASDARIAELNEDFRGKPTPTNVLSWPAVERHVPGGSPLPPTPREDPELGDIALAFETCAAEAEAAGVTLEAHATHLLVHGTLHLLGYDHENDKEAVHMEGLERAILATLGIADPY